MTEEQRKEYVEKYEQAQQVWTGDTFKHFDTPEQEAEHLHQVKEAQDKGAPF